MSILRPLAGSTVSLGQDNEVAVVISANDFALRAPGTCFGAQSCGQVHLNIDNAICNQPGFPYNNAAGEFGPGDSVIRALFSFCPPGALFGNHIITVSLRTEQGTEVIGEGGNPAKAEVSITTVP